MALYSSSSKPSFDTPHYADLRRENQFARSLEFLVREFAPIIAAAKNEPTKRIIRGKETHHGGTWNREGRNRVFNGVLPEGRLEPWRRKKEEEEEEDIYYTYIYTYIVFFLRRSQCLPFLLYFILIT